MILLPKTQSLPSTPHLRSVSSTVTTSSTGPIRTAIVALRST